MLRQEYIHDPYCQGVVFEAADLDALAGAVALVLVQEFALARSLLSNDTSRIDNREVAFTDSEIEDIVQRRLRLADPSHRDGFLFQLIMWLAAHMDLDEGDLVALPHTQASAKGQDSIVVHVGTGAEIALSICEDKATQRPRDTVRSQVWPEIQDYESGGRRDELRSNIIATLGVGGVPETEAQRLVREMSWEGKCRYRVRVTIDRVRGQHVFRGFDEIVNGGSERRRGETFKVHELRTWMASFATKVELELRRFSRQV